MESLTSSWTSEDGQWFRWNLRLD